jgi:hypothetical protein
VKSGSAELKYEGLLRFMSGRGKNGGFEYRSAAYILVREHRSAEKRRLQAAMA